MMVYFCRKCQRALAGNNLSTCSKCGGRLVSLGVDSSRWSSLSNEQKKSLLNKISSGNQTGSATSKASVSQSNPSELWLWALAFVPVISFFLLPHFITLTFSTAGVIALCLNLVFIGLDLAELKKTGDEKGAWKFVGLILVPVYLFVRASRTSRNWAPGIVWCVSYLIYLLLYVF